MSEKIAIRREWRVPLPEDLRAQLAQVVAARGEVATAEMLQLGRPALLRALAGLGVRRGTIALITIGLQKQPHPPDPPEAT